MSLKIITDKAILEKTGTRYVDYNDMFFQSVSLRNTEITNVILQRIDKAHYASEDTFIGRDKALGALNKSLLSSGCKTLLNIAYNPDICFSLAECGPNALECLGILNDGIVYWENPVLFLIKDTECNIEYNGELYSRYTDFLNKVMN